MMGHVAYEIAALECTTEKTNDRFYFEAFLLHARSLRDFFWSDGKKRSRDAVAEDFVANPSAWRSARGLWTETITDTKDPIDRQLAHLTWNRAARSDFVDLERFVQPLAAELLKQWEVFLQHVPLADAARFRAFLMQRRAEIGCSK